MIIVPEREIAGLLGPADAYKAVEAVFGAMAAGRAVNFPVIREAIGHADALYGFKSGFDRDGLALGLKSGGYWPGNAAKGLTNHQSSVFLFDADTGQCRAIVGGNLLTALRTAAASAVSINYLARKDAKVLGIVGAGHQSVFQLRAALAQRAFERIVAWNRDPVKLTRLADVAGELKIPFQAVSLPELGAMADVIITIVSAHVPLVLDNHIRPGTHIASMGTDTKGKQEIDAAIFGHATVFTDEIAQSISIGEAQHAIAAGIIKQADIHQLGAVINGKHPGRTSDSEITIFDGTGVGLQDLAVASSVVDLALARGVATKVDF